MVRALAVAAAAVFCLVPAAPASTLIFATGPATPSGTNPAGPVDVVATFTLNSIAQTISVGLINLEDNPAGVSQLISGVEFTLSNTGSGGLSPNGVSESGGTYINVSKAGFASVPGQPANQWHAKALGGTVLTLCTVCNAAVGFSDSQQMLIGGPDPNRLATDEYTQADGSIAGNRTNRPFLLASGDSYTQGPLDGKNSAPSWVLQMPVNSLKATTTITSVTFYFGDVYNAYSITDTTALTPEPATLLLFGCGLGVAAWWGRRAAGNAPKL